MIGKIRISLFVALIVTAITAQSAKQANTFQEYCDYKVSVGMLAYQAREEGHTEKEVIDSLRDYYDIPEDERIPHHIHVEHERMARDVFRKENEGEDFFVDRFYADCFELGF